MDKYYCNDYLAPDGCPIPGHHHPAPCDVDCHCSPGAPPEPGCSPVPPPIKPVLPIPGGNVQAQMCEVINQVNECINRWNYIQHNCYETLNRMVGAAVANDVYYTRDEVCMESGYNTNDSCAYHIIRIKSVDRAGQPIRMQLALAYGNTTNSNLKQSIQDVSFITNANAIITAVNPDLVGWRGNAVYQGAPIAGTTETEGYIAGFNRRGALKVFAANTDDITLCQNQIENIIGFATPIIQDGEITAEAQTLTTKAAISAIGYKSGNGEKIFFQCGNMEQPGMQGITVANVLKDMGCTTAVITSQNINADGATNSNGMMYMGVLTDAPNGWKIPENQAYWVVSKKPFCGWRNKFTSEIADLVQKVGANWNATQANEYQIEQLMDAVEKAEQALELAQEALDKIAEINAELDEVQEHLTTIDGQISDLQEGLATETAERKAADETLQQNIDNEESERKVADAQLQTNIETETANRTAADAVLQGNINQEAIDRANADLQIQQTIAKEVADRTSADQLLQDQIQDFVDGSTELPYVKRAGDTMTGPLILSGDATQPLQAVTFRQIPEQYTLPIASAQTLGGVRVGQNLTITPEGVLNATSGGGSADYTAGPGIIISGTEISIDTDYLEAHPELMPYLLLSGGTMAGNIVMGTNQIKGLANGTDTNDAVNLSQLTAVENEVDAIKNGTTDLPYLPLAGGSMTGDIDANEHTVTGLKEPVDTTDAIPLGWFEDYVDTHIGTGPFLPLSGGTMVGGATIEAGQTDGDFYSLSVGTTNANCGQIQIGSVSNYTNPQEKTGHALIISSPTSPGAPQFAVDNRTFDGHTYKNNNILTLHRDSADGVVLNAGGMKIIELGTPTNPLDAVNLQYITDNIGTGPFLPLSGGTMNGDIFVPNEFQIKNNNNNSFVEFGTNFLRFAFNGVYKLGVSRNGASLFGNILSGVDDPVNSTDAVNKRYVDSVRGKTSTTSVISYSYLGTFKSSISVPNYVITNLPENVIIRYEYPTSWDYGGMAVLVGDGEQHNLEAETRNSGRTVVLYYKFSNGTLEVGGWQTAGGGSYYNGQWIITIYGG